MKSIVKFNVVRDVLHIETPTNQLQYFIKIEYDSAQVTLSLISSFPSGSDIISDSGFFQVSRYVQNDLSHYTLYDVGNHEFFDTTIINKNV